MRKIKSNLLTLTTKTIFLSFFQKLFYSNIKNTEITEFYKDKQSGEIVNEEEMLDLVDSDDNLDSFYLIGDFETKEEAQEAFDKNNF